MGERRHAALAGRQSRADRGRVEPGRTSHDVVGGIGRGVDQRDAVSGAQSIGAVTHLAFLLEDSLSWRRGRRAATTPAAPKPRTDDDRREQRRKGADARRDLAPKRQEIKSIESSLAKLGQERARLETELAGIDYGRNAANARKVTERHAAVLAEVEQLETRWLELSERLES